MKNVQTEEILYSARDIKKRVKEIAKQINEEFKDKDPVIIGILTGSFIFCADLIRELTIPFEFHFISAKSYLNSTVSSGNVQLSSINFSVKDRNIILIDDILDTGHTLEALIKKFEGEKVKSIFTIVLFNKTARRVKEVEADIVGFDVDNYYLVGYGLDDDKNRNRHYPDVYKLD